MQAGSSRLVSARVDGLLVGWLAVGVWVAAAVSPSLGLPLSAWHLSALFWVGAAVSAAHFGVSYHLAYGGGIRAAIRRHPLALGVGPLLIAAALAVPVVASLRAGHRAAAGTSHALITAVYLATTWHYVKQVYGVGRIGAAFGGVKLTLWEARALRYGLYPMWWLGASAVLTQGTHNIVAGYAFGYEVLPPQATRILQVCAWTAAAVVGAAIATACRRAQRRPPSILLAAYAAAVLWLAVPTSPLLLLALLAPFHALQYLVVAHRAEVALAAPRPGVAGATWWLSVFGGATAGALLALRWAPQWLDAHVVGSQGPLLFTAAAFVFLNLHHYLIDAVIWRSDAELVKAVVRGSVPVPAPREPAQPPASSGVPALSAAISARSASTSA